MNGAVRTALIGVAFLVGACAASPGAPTSATLPSPIPTPTAVPATATPVPTPTTLPSEGPGAFTTDDVAIAKIIKESAADAIPKLGTVASLSLEKQTALFQPVAAWINAQEGHIAEHSPSSCIKDAVDVFNDAMGRYRNLAKDFLDWREWGAAGLPYTLSVPKRIATVFGDAVTALEAHCPLPT